jgi:glycogen operon protein
LGASWDGTGVNFAIYSAHAEAVDLCLFDSPYADREYARLPLTEHTHQVWHGYVPHLMPGQLYAYRIRGPWAPASGQRFNPAKLVMDPYVRAIGRRLRWHDSLFGFRLDSPHVRDESDSAAWAPLGAVVDGAFAWGDDQPPRTPWQDTVIYEMHVRGFTRRHPGVPDDLRGTYLGLVSEPAIEHLKSLGITAVELLPIHVHVDEQHLLKQGLSNYWGYNTLGFFAPDPRYAVSRTPLDTVREFKTMVRALHAAGIEVILDVVYNHTAEGSHLGPQLSFRGIDNLTYYRLQPVNLSLYEDFSGCGNTLNARHPQVLKLMMDSLRYWVTEMRVDGFRFDLATALARETIAFDPSSAFFDVIHQDPILSGVKLIAEPWDLGEHGYQVGHFPPGWSEWNARYRDSSRRFWRGDRGQIAEFATRIAGSSDLYQTSGRQPLASVNYVTCHDGFTLHDLVSYSRKHNEANKEFNQDGESNNLSANHGVEGPTTDPAILDLRFRQMRNYLATLAISQGVPMLLAGDESARTQLGNNNAYCQDNEISWLDWMHTDRETTLLEFTRNMLAIRHAHQVLRRRRYFDGRGHNGERDLSWIDPAGHEITAAQWANPELHVFGMRVSASVVDERTGATDPVEHDVLLALFNSAAANVPFLLPSIEGCWTLLVDTVEPTGHPAQFRPWHDGESYPLQGHSFVLLRADPVAPPSDMAPRKPHPSRRPRRRASDYR